VLPGWDHETYSSEPHLEIILVEGVEDIKNMPHRHWARHSIDTPADGSPYTENWLGCCWNQCTTLATM
jgi:hypothetical protein